MAVILRHALRPALPLKENTMIVEAGFPSNPTDEATAPIRRIIKNSVSLILKQQAPTGAYPAAPDFSAYAGYCWFRDGSYIADAMSAAGEIESAERFFDWCSIVLTSRSATIRHIIDETRAGRPPANENMLPTRFTLEGANGNDDWWDFQLDGYGTWLWALAEHYARHDRPLDNWREAIALTVEYLTTSWDRPCYDWWEEFPEHTHVSTLGCIASGLDSIAKTGQLQEPLLSVAVATSDRIRQRVHDAGIRNNHLTKWLGTEALDASLLALIAPMNFLDPTSSIGKTTIGAIEEELTVNNGVHRYLADTYYGGGQWPLLSCFLGLACNAAGDRSRAHALLEWVASTAGPADEIPEQVEQHLLDPAHLQPWNERWGSSAAPLLWSHAMYVRLATELGIPHITDQSPAKESAQ